MPTESKLSSLLDVLGFLGVRETGRRPASGKSIPFQRVPSYGVGSIHRQGSSLRPHGFTEGQAEMPITTIKRARERDNEQG